MRKAKALLVSFLVWVSLVVILSAIVVVFYPDQLKQGAYFVDEPDAAIRSFPHILV
jgi:hypothetical protein